MHIWGGGACEEEGVQHGESRGAAFRGRAMARISLHEAAETS